MSVTDLATAREAAETTRELTKVSRAIASKALTAELALERRDWTVFYETAEDLIALDEVFRVLRRRLLVMGVRG